MKHAVQPIFTSGANGTWTPGQLAMGPFAGLQGGAIAGLMVGEIEALAGDVGWGDAIAASIWFLRPCPLVELTTKPVAISAGKRLTVVDNSLCCSGDDRPVALARVTLAKAAPIGIAGLSMEPQGAVDPTGYPVIAPRAPHGGAWFMDAMEVRREGLISWFRMRHPIIDGGGPLSQALGPADWAHGINRPANGVVADPNPNLSVQLARSPNGAWLGVDAQSQWNPATGSGIGGGLLMDCDGVVGRVAMSVALTPFAAR